MKKSIRVFLIILGVIATCLMALIAPIDFTPLKQLDEVQSTYEELKGLKIHESTGKDTLLAGWNAINITPKKPIHMAGYGRRGPYVEVVDSLYSRSVVLDNGHIKSTVISVDLLLFPQEAKTIVEDSLSKLGFAKENIFFTATHTHNGFGNWEKTKGGKFAFGPFDMQNTNHLTNQIIAGVLSAIDNLSKVQVGFAKYDANNLVINRLAGDAGTKDPYLRVISLKKENGALGLMVSFAGHPTNLKADIWNISRDYPGVLVDDLEQESEIDFAMFCAGMMGSHSIKSDLPKGHERITSTGKVLAGMVKKGLKSMDYQVNSMISTADMDIMLPPSQMRISEGWHIRDWLFRSLMGPLLANIKLLEIGDILMIGMPCDYSGELSVNNQLDQYAAAKGKQLFITSFNGNYVGYITEDSHYQEYNKSEVREMNWVGPFKGEYFTSAIKKIIDATSE